jgi:hypothetical protein
VQDGGGQPHLAYRAGKQAMAAYKFAVVFKENHEIIRQMLELP